MIYSEENFRLSKSNDEFEFECKNCGNTFSKTKRYISKNSLILPNFCCQECSHDYKNLGVITVKCEFCGKEKEMKKSEYNRSESKKFFCNHSCAAKLNNQLFQKRIGTNENLECPICGGSKSRNSEMCQKCRNVNKRIIGEDELGKYIGYGDAREKYISSKCQSIRKNAKIILEEDVEREKICAYCKNHEFDSILEVHHIKPISSFDEHTKIKVINDKTNLVWLCPNHHTMLEKGLIKI